MRIVGPETIHRRRPGVQDGIARLVAANPPAIEDHQHDRSRWLVLLTFRASCAHQLKANRSPVASYPSPSNTVIRYVQMNCDTCDELLPGTSVHRDRLGATNRGREASMAIETRISGETYERLALAEPDRKWELRDGHLRKPAMTLHHWLAGARLC